MKFRAIRHVWANARVAIRDANARTSSWFSAFWRQGTGCQASWKLETQPTLVAVLLRRRALCRSHLAQSAAGGFRDTSKVFINALRCTAASRRRNALIFHLFHTEDATKDSQPEFISADRRAGRLTSASPIMVVLDKSPPH
jgi:hypothetical protein